MSHQALSETAVTKLLAGRRAEAADLRARVGAMDMVNAAPTTPTLDELRDRCPRHLRF
jgi:hypothetical protein